MTSRRRAAGMALLVCLPVVAGCAAPRGAGGAGPADLLWPPQNPRIRLVKVIDLQEARTPGSSRLLEWLGGGKTRLEFRRPYAVAWDGDDLLVADPDLGRVARFAPGGKVTLSPEGIFLHPIGVAACPQGIAVTDSGSGRLAILDRDLRGARFIAEGLSRPTGVGCDPDRIVLAETTAHRIRLIEGAGAPRVLGERGGEPGRFNFPASLALDGGTLLVGDTLNFRIQRIDPASGRSLGTFGRLGDSPGETPRIKGLAVDAAGRLWVSDAILDQVSIYDREGAFLMSLGEHGSDPGQFSFPAGIAAHPDGRVVVVDSLNRRLQVFGPAGPGTSGGY